MLAAWVEQYPIQAPGDGIGFTLWTARDWRRDMIVSYTPADQGCEPAPLAPLRVRGATMGLSWMRGRFSGGYAPRCSRWCVCCSPRWGTW